MDLIFNNKIMQNKIANLESQIEVLNKEQNVKRKFQITAEILTPIVKEIRNSMKVHDVPDYYCCKLIIDAILLRLNGHNISWEISDFNRNYQSIQFDLRAFNELETIIRTQTNLLNVDNQTLLELLQIKFDRNQEEHDSIKNFIRFNASEDSSFNAYLAANGNPNVFSVNEKLCLDTIYRNDFLFLLEL